MANLRPRNFDEYIGQDSIKPLLMGIIVNCNKTHKPLGHTLCFGPPGTGKTSLAGICADALDDYRFIGLTASKDWTPDTLRRILLDLPVDGYSRVTNDGAWIPQAPKYLVFIDEIAEIRGDVWTSVMLNAMEDGELHIGATTSWLPELTIFGATTDPYRIPAAALSRFNLQLHLTPYSVEDLEKIIGRVYPALSDSLKAEVAQRSRGIARLALNFAEGVSLHGMAWFEALKIDAEGLTELDRKYLAALESGRGTPMALGTIANIVCENPRTLQTFVEPEMQRLGKITISAHGRALTNISRGAKTREN
jgi:Holliday junction DNA helicase RuvB